MERKKVSDCCLEHLSMPCADLTLFSQHTTKVMASKWLSKMECSLSYPGPNCCWLCCSRWLLYILRRMRYFNFKCPVLVRDSDLTGNSWTTLRARKLRVWPTCSITLQVFMTSWVCNCCSCKTSYFTYFTNFLPTLERLTLFMHLLMLIFKINFPPGLQNIRVRTPIALEFHVMFRDTATLGKSCSSSIKGVSRVLRGVNTTFVKWKLEYICKHWVC